MLTAETALRRVTYEEMLEDWFIQKEEEAAPEGKPVDIKNTDYLKTKQRSLGEH